jgi:hypothetical protein
MNILLFFCLGNFIIKLVFISYPGKLFQPVGNYFKPLLQEDQ